MQWKSYLDMSKKNKREEVNEQSFTLVQENKSK